MKIVVFGAGYVGLVSAACFADMGNDVVCIERDAARAQAIEAGRLPLYEPGLDAIVERNLRARRLKLATQADAGTLHGRHAVFIAVGTPSADDGAADLSQVREVAHTIGRHIDQYTVVVNKSTVPVGTADEVARIVRAELELRGDDGSGEALFDVVSNPEFLKEGAAVHDFQRPDRIVIGAASARAIGVMRELYAPISRQRDQGLFTLISGSRRPLPACQSRRATQRVPLHTQGAQRRVARRQGPSLRVARPGGRLRRCPRLQGSGLAAHGRLASSPQAGQRDPRN